MSALPCRVVPRRVTMCWTRLPLTSLPSPRYPAPFIPISPPPPSPLSYFHPWALHPQTFARPPLPLVFSPLDSSNLNLHPSLLCGVPAAGEPRCGFSRRVVDALSELQLAFGSCDILGDEALRQVLKEYKQWPTYPQLYVKVRGAVCNGRCDA